MNLGNHISNRNFHVIRRKQHRFRGVITYQPMLSCRGENENRRTHNHEVSTTPLLEASLVGQGSKKRAKGCAGEGRAARGKRENHHAAFRSEVKAKMGCLDDGNGCQGE